MRGSGGVHPHSRHAWLIALAALALTIGAAIPTAANAAPQRPSAASQTATGSISGTVTATNGEPISGATVTLLLSSGPAGTATTGADGTYAISNLAPNGYVVEFDAPGYVRQYWKNYNAELPVGATTVRVSSGQSITGIDAQMRLAAMVRGAVTGPNGKPLAGASVAPVAYGVPPTTTAADGTYTLNLDPDLMGSWTIQFSHVGYVTQSAGPYTLTGGQTLIVNVQLQASPPNSATLDGTVFGPGNPIAAVDGATVVVHNYFGFVVAQTTTNGPLGAWSISGLTGGVYRVEYQPPAGSNLLGQWYDNKPDMAHSDTVSLITGQRVDLPAPFLSTGGGVSGTVTSAGQPVQGATVSLFTLVNNTPNTEIAHATTDQNGNYSISGLQDAFYFVLFNPPAGSAEVGQWWQGQKSAAGASLVDVNDGQQITGIDATLTAGQRGSINGTVTNGNGGAIAGLTVKAVAADGTAATTATTGANGTYTIANLDVGIDTVWFVPPSGSSYRASYWNSNIGQVLPLTVDQGSKIGGINAKLSQNGTVSGTVRGLFGPIAGATVTVTNYYGFREADATTGADGTYTATGLAPGSSRIQFTASGFVTQWWNNQPDIAHSNTINVPNGGTATANATLGSSA